MEGEILIFFDLKCKITGLYLDISHNAEMLYIQNEIQERLAKIRESLNLRIISEADAMFPLSCKLLQCSSQPLRSISIFVFIFSSGDLNCDSYHLALKTNYCDSWLIISEVTLRFAVSFNI